MREGEGGEGNGEDEERRSLKSLNKEKRINKGTRKETQ